MHLVPIFFFLATALAYGFNDASDVLLAGGNSYNTRDFDSGINKNNVGRLAVNWVATLCGQGTATPLVKDGSVYISDFGQCYQRFDRDTGAVLFKKNMTADYGFPIGLYARGMPTYFNDGYGGLTILGTTSVKNLLNPGVGAWLFATRLLTGDLIWKTTVSTFPWTILTQSPLVLDGVIYVGTSSGESAAPIIPGYQCCAFNGGMGAWWANNGSLIWFENNIPLDIAGVGNYSGASVWGSTPVVVGNDIYFGSGQLYAMPDDAAACVNANPLNSSCLDPRVMTNAIIRRDIRTGALLNFTRLTPADCWNIACFLGLPSCQTPIAAFDFDITSVQYSAQTNTLYAGSKSGFMWSFNRDLSIRWGDMQVRGSSAGGFVWQNALQDDCNLSDLNLYGVFTNSAKNTWVFNGQNTTAGGVVRYDGNGNLKAILASPTGDQMYGAATATNNVVFASDRTSGNLYALHGKTLQPLWTFNASALMSSGPAVVDKEVFWGTGATTFGKPPTPQKLYAFKLASNWGWP